MAGFFDALMNKKEAPAAALPEQCQAIVTRVTEEAIGENKDPNRFKKLNVGQVLAGAKLEVKEAGMASLCQLSAKHVETTAAAIQQQQAAASAKTH